MSSPFLECNSFSFHPITTYVDDLVHGLSDPEWEELAATAKLLTRGYRSGGPLAGARPVHDSSVRGLFELEVAAGEGSQLLLGVRDGVRILCAHAVDGPGERLPRWEIEQAERAIAEYRRKVDERAGGRKRKRPG